MEISLALKMPHTKKSLRLQIFGLNFSVKGFDLFFSKTKACCFIVVRSLVKVTQHKIFFSNGMRMVSLPLQEMNS